MAVPTRRAVAAAGPFARPASCSSGLFRASLLPTRRAAALICAAARRPGSEGEEPSTSGAERRLQPRAGRQQERPSWARAARAGAAAAAAALVALLPAGAARALDALPPLDAPLLEGGADPELMFEGAGPELLEVMFVVVATYVGLMILYLWLASMIDEDAAAGDAKGGGQSGAGAQDQPQQGLPPAYGEYLHAHIRSVREPRRGHALVAPSAQDDPEAYAAGVTGLKAALSGQAADFVASQVKECGSVARRKIYLRRLAARETGKPPHSCGPAVGGGGGGGGGALALGQPGQLELLVDECLDNMPDSVLADGSEECLVRSITGAVARRLAAAEASELVRSMQAALQERRGKDNHDSPAAWGF